MEPVPGTTSESSTSALPHSFSATRAAVAAALAVSGLDGAAVSITGASGIWHRAHTSDPTAARLDEQQILLGEGPCHDAYRTGDAAALLNSRDPSGGGWPEFARAASGAGVGAVFAFPLYIGNTILGVAQFHRVTHGALLPATTIGIQQLLPGLAAVVTSDASAKYVGPEPATTEDLLFVAVGMVSAQLGTSTAKALDSLRASAFADDLALNLIAEQVVSGERRYVP